jgi:ABC-type nitrate/sulfonate/bicarbonate transport system substrate-binding protein
MKANLLRPRDQRHGGRLVLGAIVLITVQFLQGISVFAAAPSKYVIGYATYTARIVPLWLAKEQGFFAKYGIEVDPVFIRGAPTLVAGLAAGSIHKLEDSGFIDKLYATYGANPK